MFSSVIKEALSKDIEEIQQGFLEADTDRSGSLSKDEVRSVFRDYVSPLVTTIRDYVSL